MCVTPLLRNAKGGRAEQFLSRLGKGFDGSVEALQQSESSKAQPDYTAEASGQLGPEFVEGKYKIGLSDHFAHFATSLATRLGVGVQPGDP
jgi:hypothetical protein